MASGAKWLFSFKEPMSCDDFIGLINGKDSRLHLRAPCHLGFCARVFASSMRVKGYGTVISSIVSIFPHQSTI